MVLISSAVCMALGVFSGEAQYDGQADPIVGTWKMSEALILSQSWMSGWAFTVPVFPRMGRWSIMDAEMWTGEHGRE